jgi:hypothetical protein
MLSKEQNEMLTRIGPGTPMGETLREFWIPAIRSARLEVDGPSQRVRVFGQDFVAFRDTNGKVGFLDEGCPHRGVSLALGRNKERLFPATGSNFSKARSIRRMSVRSTAPGSPTATT